MDEVLKRLVGSWRGTCRTWFEPGELADEAEVSGTFAPMAGGQVLRHAYTGTLGGELREGEEWLVRNAVTGRYEVAFVDSHHMNYAVMHSVGDALPAAEGVGFAVEGTYDVFERDEVTGEARPGVPWGWRTVYRLGGDDRLTVTAYNVPPGGEAYRGVELVYVRQA